VEEEAAVEEAEVEVAAEEANQRQDSKPPDKQ
jgi:hypothetical protein